MFLFSQSSVLRALTYEEQERNRKKKQGAKARRDTFKKATMFH